MSRNTTNVIAGNCKLRVATWKSSGLCSECKLTKKEVVKEHNIDIGCVPTDSAGTTAMDDSFNKPKDVHFNKRKGLLLGDFNAKVGKSVEMDDVIGTCMFGEETCNTIVAIVSFFLE